MKFPIGSVISCIEVPPEGGGAELIQVGKEYTVIELNDQGSPYNDDNKYVTVSDLPYYIWSTSCFVLSKAIKEEKEEFLKVLRENKRMIEI